MDTATEAEHIPDHNQDTSVAALEEMVRILDALGHEDALAIFIYAEQGISSSKVAIEELNLTQKRFYSRLKDLIEAGLIEKIEGEYKYTTLGRVFSKIGFSLLEVIENKEQFELLDTIRTNPALSNSDFEKISSVISGSTEEISGIFNSIFPLGERRELKTLENYEELVTSVSENIKTSTKSVVIATNYLDVRVMSCSLEALEKGIEMKCLFPKTLLSSKLTKFKMMLSPKYMMSLLSFMKTDIEINTVLREVDVPFSFVVIDGQKCYFELPKIDDNFAIAFYLEDKNVGNKFNKLFNQLWNMADYSQTLEFFNKMKNL